MNNYFSFQRMVTASFVRALYFLGFVAITSASIALIVWAGLQLRQANIERTLGWRYVIIGAAALTAGNLIWRVFCELWVVLFNIHDRLASIDENLTEEPAESLRPLPAVVPSTIQGRTTTRVMDSRVTEPAPRTAGILGLS